MKKILKVKIVLLLLVINSVLNFEINSQTGVSISGGVMEHKVAIPDLTSDELTMFPMSLTLKHFFEKTNFELGLSYYLFGTSIERHGVYKYPYEYSYWYRARKPINLIGFCGIRSDRNKFIQTYGGILTGYWSYKMLFSSQNWSNFNGYERINDRVHQLALGPKFGISIGRKVQFIIEAEYFLLTKTKYSDQNIPRVSSISLGFKYNFKRKEKAAKII